MPQVNTYVAFLRGVNIGGRRPLKMAHLTDSLKAVFTNAKTYIASGNIVLASHETSVDQVAKLVKDILLKEFGYDDIPVMVRTVQELRQSIDDNPFLSDPRKHKGNGPYLAWLDTMPCSRRVQMMARKDYSPERYELHCDLRLVYFSYWKQCKLDTTILERELQVMVTNRNLRTIQKLLDLAVNMEQETNHTNLSDVSWRTKHARTNGDVVDVGSAPGSKKKQRRK